MIKDQFYKETIFRGFSEAEIHDLKNTKEFYALDQNLRMLSKAPRDVVMFRRMPRQADSYQLTLILSQKVTEDYKVLDVYVEHIGDNVKSQEFESVYHRLTILRKKYQIQTLKEIDTVLEQVMNEWVRHIVFALPGKMMSNSGEHYVMTVKDLALKGYAKTKKGLVDMGYDGADIHWLHNFFELGLIVTNPGTKERREQELEAHKANMAFDRLVSGGDKFYIDQAIEFGRVGLTYTQIQFKNKEDENSK